jgi:hypothetical protein
VFSLTPGFSPVTVAPRREKPFQRFSPLRQAVKTAVFHTAFHTRLKPGVNEISQSFFYFASFTFGL